jgi:hypothetical protein
MKRTRVRPTRTIHVPRPCDQCPFRRVGGVRLRATRITEIARAVLGPAGGSFTCHKTTGFLGPVRPKYKDQQCAGAFIFAEKHDAPTQLMRIAERLGLYNAAALMTPTNVAAIFDTVDEMRATALDRGERRPKRARPAVPVP